MYPKLFDPMCFLTPFAIMQIAFRTESMARTETRGFRVYRIFGFRVMVRQTVGPCEG